MSRKHFIAIAAALRDAEEQMESESKGDLYRSYYIAAYAREVRTKVARELASNCPRFNIDRFMKAATFVPAT